MRELKCHSPSLAVITAFMQQSNMADFDPLGFASRFVQVKSTLQLLILMSGYIWNQIRIIDYFPALMLPGA